MTSWSWDWVHVQHCSVCSLLQILSPCPPAPLTHSLSLKSVNQCKATRLPRTNQRICGAFVQEPSGISKQWNITPSMGPFWDKGLCRVYTPWSQPGLVNPWHLLCTTVLGFPLQEKAGQNSHIALSKTMTLSKLNAVSIVENKISDQFLPPDPVS